MKAIATGIFILLHFLVGAQLVEKSKLESKMVPSVSINNDFNAQHWIFGLSVGVEDVGLNWGARLGFNLSPIYKAVQVKEGNIFRQYREQKYFLSLDLDKRFLNFDIKDSKIHLFAGLRSGIMLGNYKGTQNNAKAFGVVAPMGGICYNHNDTFFVKVGYCYFDDRLSEVSDSRITTAVIFTF